MYYRKNSWLTKVRKKNCNQIFHLYWKNKIENEFNPRPQVQIHPWIHSSVWAEFGPGLGQGWARFGPVLGQVWARFGPGWRIHLTRSDQSNAINLLIAACQEFCSTIKEYENSYKHISTEIKLLQKENLTRLLILQENLVYFGTSDITKISRYSTCMKNLLYFWTFNMSNI